MEARLESTSTAAPARDASVPAKLSVLIPAYHEESTVAQVIHQVLRAKVEPLGLEMQIIVCDDGSQDGTSRVIAAMALEDPRIELVRHAANRGKGAAIRTALAQATGQIVIIQDADLEYSVDDYPALLSPIVAGRADVVYGSRFLLRRWPGGMRPANLLANKILTWTSNTLFRHRITDEATAFKVFRTSLLRSLDLECDGFNFCPEVTAKLGLTRERIVEVPVQYQARNIDRGKKVRWTDGLKAMGTLMKYRLR